MDDLKPIDGLKPDSNDHRPTPLRTKSLNGSRFAVSHQRIMIGMGILVLLLIIIAILSAFEAPPPHKIKQRHEDIVTKEANLSDNLSVAPHTPVLLNVEESENNRPLQEAKIPQTFAASNETLPQTPLPSPPKDTHSPAATVTPQTLPKSNNNSDTNDAKVIINNKNTKTATKASSTKLESIQTNDALRLAPGHHFTLQLSSASQPETLNTYAKQQKLTHYQIYETKRNTQPWYILVSGNYATLTEAKTALTQLPDAIKIKNPWIKPIHQLQQDLKIKN
ncbi:SPOR domain-containing protein [Candidatus Regiella insecticola]|uniref:Cell division protein DamX n=1 Tax=Candidatus Regiella insecticola TaxID=138073 RepID=A0A6L2ZJW5_9ENTR|nr:SPOR domain-containing protein [Candidatus Regiella insecticola]GFN45157.1 cell division protein DamX [Candidatus Regiella insecticola]